MEIEIKQRFANKDDFDRFKSHMFSIATAHHTQIQTNHFFNDTEGYFNTNRIALRLREINNDGLLSYKITIKGRHTIVDGVSSAAERETDITPEFFRAALEDPTKILTLDWPYGLEMIDSVKSLVYIGNFKTIRSCVTIQEVPELFEIDETHFPETVEYELEVESIRASEVMPFIIDLANSLNIELRASTQSKFKTFLTQLKQ